MADIVTVTDTNITMVQGDTLSFSVEILGITDDLDSASFTAKEFYDQENYSISKSLGDGIERVGSGEDSVFYRVRIAPEDTEDLDKEKYFYSLKILLDDDVFTILKGMLFIEPTTRR